MSVPPENQENLMPADDLIDGDESELSAIRGSTKSNQPDNTKEVAVPESEESHIRNRKSAGPNDHSHDSTPILPGDAWHRPYDATVPASEESPVRNNVSESAVPASEEFPVRNNVSESAVSDSEGPRRGDAMHRPDGVGFSDAAWNAAEDNSAGVGSENATAEVGQPSLEKKGFDPNNPPMEPSARSAALRVSNGSKSQVSIDDVDFGVETIQAGSNPRVPNPLAGAPQAIQQAQPDDGIEILVKLAESGEIDPKNVDIIDVTDKFLKAIAAAPRENLRQSGKVLFHACVLLRMKAEALLAAAVDPGDDFLDFEDGDGTIIFDSNNQAVGRQITLHDLERALVRKAHSRQNRQRRVTLEQLIAALRQAESIEKTREQKQPKARIELAGYHEVNDVDDILDLAHDEDIESTIDHVQQILEQYLQTGETMQLVHIIRLLDRHGDWVDAFLACLFLSNAGTITLEQETFWGPLNIVRCEPQPQQARLAGNA